MVRQFPLKKQIRVRFSMMKSRCGLMVTTLTFQVRNLGSIPSIDISSWSIGMTLGFHPGKVGFDSL